MTEKAPHAAAHGATPARGRVLLVGAGPGAADLLTRRAVRALRSADVVLVDDLVSDAVLRFARRGARVVPVGKRGGCTSTPQDFIDRLMVTRARAGDVVVRLKGGDPSLFGRAGEEARALRAQGIDVEVINGITAGVAAATALGVPLTHRDHAQGVIFITGHPRQGGSQPHWASIAAAAAHGLTLIIYMGVTTVAAVQAGLLQGLAAATPAALVRHASLPGQRVWLCTLGELAATVRRERVASPAIIVVGDVLRALHELAASADRSRAA